MVKLKSISSEDKDFFTLVWKAVFANPFSHERADLDQKISGVTPPCSMGRHYPTDN